VQQRGVLARRDVWSLDGVVALGGRGLCLLGWPCRSRGPADAVFEFRRSVVVDGFAAAEGRFLASEAELQAWFPGLVAWGLVFR